MANWLTWKMPSEGDTRDNCPLYFNNCVSGTQHELLSFLRTSLGKYYWHKGQFWSIQIDLYPSELSFQFSRLVEDTLNPLGHPETKEVIEWFKTLPIYLDLEDLAYLRVIHACWDQKSIDEAHSKSYLNPDGTLNQFHLADSAKKKTPLFEIIEQLLKGSELQFPDHVEPFRTKMARNAEKS